jgi:hypothetical protein
LIRLPNRRDHDDCLLLTAGGGLKLRNRYPEPEHVRHQSQKGRKVRIRFPSAVSPYLGFVMLFTKVCGRTLVQRGCGARRRSPCIGRGNVDASLALRTHRVGIKDQTRLPRYLRASRAGFKQHRDPTQHQVWCLQALARAHERADRGACHRQHAPPEQRVTQHLVRQAEAARPIVESDALFADQPAGARMARAAMNRRPSTRGLP